MKTLWLAVLYGLLLGILASGALYLVARPPQGAPVVLLPPPTAQPIWVDVQGSVANPGLVQLPPGSRVADALQAAGGLLPNADAHNLNQAAFLEDGSQIKVAAQPTSPRVDSSGVAALPSTPVPPAAASSTGGLVNLNTASLQELDTLPGIGPALAQEIINYRTANGDFKQIEDLMNVTGIGPAKFEQLKLLITVGVP
ncbi:MAG: hypothetical protein OHK0052_02940 [Anaerolineales bacterium]